MGKFRKNSCIFTRGKVRNAHFMNEEVYYFY